MIYYNAFRKKGWSTATIPFSSSLFSFRDDAGKLLVDATCAPADVAYPTDLNLLNEAREKNRSDDR